MSTRKDLLFPMNFSIQTTSLCNAACVFCPYEDIKNLFPSKVMDMVLYKKIIDETAGYKNVERLILYMNNEPLTDPFIFERIDYAKEKVPWAGVHILTNGLLLTDENSQKLLNSKLDWIGISCQGIRKQTIEKAMGLPYKLLLKRITGFIERAKEKKNIKDYLMITFLRHEYLSQDEKNEAMDFWREKGIERISYFEGPISRAGNVSKLPKTYHEQKIVGCNSIWAEEMIHIVEDGKVVLCCMDWRREVLLGDLNRQSIYEIWNNRHRKVWDMISGDYSMPGDFLCRRCEEAALKKEDSGLKQDPDALLSSLTIQSDKVLLVMCPCWGIDNPPLGLASIGAYLKSRGIPAKALDLNIEIYYRASDKLKELWDFSHSSQWWIPSVFESKTKPLFREQIVWAAEQIIKEDADVIGFSVYAPNRLFTAEVIKEIRRLAPDKKIILGGRGIYDQLERYSFPDDLVDFFVIGEGEELLCKILKGDYQEAGIIRKGQDNTSAYFMKSLEDFPLITYEDFPLGKYREKSISLLMNRGCSFRCGFCNDWRYIGKLRTRNPKAIYQEIEYHLIHNGIKKFYFNDQAINVNVRELEKLCDFVIEAKFRIEWTALAIPSKSLNYGLLCKMKKAGLRTLNYGIESGSQRVLKLMNKSINLGEVKEVLENTRKAGIDTQLNFVVGFPGENEEDFAKTKEFIRSNLKNISGITNLNMCNVTLGSDLMVNSQKYGVRLPENREIIDTHWTAEDNTYEVRLKRIRELIDFTREKGIFVFTSNAPREPETLELRVLETEKSKAQSREKSSIDDSGDSQEELILVMAPPWETKMIPLGLAYLSSFLKSKGVKVKVIDLNVSLFNSCKDSRRCLWDIATINSFTPTQLAHKLVEEFSQEFKDFIEEVSRSPAKLIGFSTTVASGGIAVHLAHQIKLRDPSKITIIGGPGCYWNTYYVDPERVTDILVVGEGELPLLEIVERFRNNSSLSNLLGIQGTLVCIDKQYFPFLDPNPLKDIDQIPFPSFSEFNLKDYNKESMYKPLPLLISRGCINNCSFCVDYRMNHPFRVRDPLKVLEEIKFHMEHYSVKDFQFNDLLCNGNLRQLERVCDLIIEEKLGIQWTSYAAIRQGMSLELCRKMRKAGCRYICYGTESGSDVVLKKMKKRYNSKLAEEVIRNTHNAGIDTAINIILGHPGESEKEFRNTCAFIKRNKDYIYQVTNVSSCFLMPESDLMENLSGYGVYFKQSLKDRLNRLFRKRKFQPNHRKFYVRPGNTPVNRARWVRRFLKLLHRLNISYVIINYVKEYDRNLEKFLARLGATTHVLNNRHLRLDASCKGRCKLYFKGRELTKDVGMNTSFFVDGNWIDSSSGQWTVKRSRRLLKIKIRWPDASIMQEWDIQLKARLLDWKVRTYFDDTVRLHQKKIGLILSDKYNKFISNGSISDFPEEFTTNWSDILFLDIPDIKILTSQGLPEFVLEGQFKEKEFIQLQNSPVSLSARMANFCLFENNNTQGYNTEGRNFKKGEVLEEKIKLHIK
ncbi:MAG: radical SAM protein [Candidatus Omnitrophica bacterium]|nr:radical SAM protein [Candidatus Omnitrophota bacterium]